MTEPKLSELPNGWVWTKLEDISEKIEKVNPRNHEKEELIYIDIASIDNTNQKIISPKIYLGKDAPSRARQLIKAGDILFSTVRTYLKNIAIVGKEYDGQIASTGFCVIRPNKSINNKFIFYFSQTDLFINSLNQIQRGTSYPAVRDSDVFSQPFPLAPFPEQCRIVVRIEELFSRLDAGVEALQRAKAQLQRYRQAVLKAAVEGRLTEEWRRTHPEVEPAEKLLEKILRERRTEWEAKQRSQGKDRSHLAYREPTPPDLFSLPELPVQWCWATTEQLASTERHSLAIGPFGSNLKVEDYRDEGVPLIFVRNIRSATFDGPDTRYVSNQKAEELRAHKVESGDILITKMGEPPGDACLYPENMPTAIITADCIKLNLSKLLQEKEFFVHALNSNLVRRQFLGITKGVAQKKVSLQRFKWIAIPLAPQAEEHNIVAELERNFSVVEETENIISSSLIRADRLRQSILKCAFEGKLVPQDTNDEPAKELLDRIVAKKKKHALIKETKYSNKKLRTKERKPEIDLYELLCTSTRSLTPSDLWILSNVDIEDFYRILKLEIEKGRIIEDKINNKLIVRDE